MSKKILYIGLLFVLFFVIYKIISMYNALGGDEMQSKYEYSMLEALGNKNSESKNNTTYKIFEHPRGKSYSDAVAIGLPTQNKNKGYVMVLTSTEHQPLIKVFPDDISFVFKEEWLDEIKSQVSLSMEVEKYLLKHCDQNSSLVPIVPNR